ncbi:MAG TPA: hypothetical protein VML75_18105 [Kofleriaceae bacterium]|nr:hypothetical protein [Kofleriaceae bacterium]
MNELELCAAIRDGAARYAGLTDQPSRTTERARLLHLLERLRLSRGAPIITRRVSGAELRADPVLRGAAVVHLDLMFRSSVTADEVLFTANRGIVRLGFHSQLEDVPVGVVLAQPCRRLVRSRAELFDVKGPQLGESSVVMPYAVAASPGRVGVGGELIRACIADCAKLSSPPRVVTLSTLTGMRARVIRMVDGVSPLDPRDADSAVLRAQLLELLAVGEQPETVPEPARSWLAAENRLFAASTDYAVGNFHRAMGASLVGLSEGADPSDSDALWARAYFDYGLATSSLAPA